MRRNLIVFFLLLVAVSWVLAQDKPNFSGTWVLDRDKSDPMGFGRAGGGGGGAGREGGGGGRAMGPVDITLVIKHEANTLAITQKMNMGGEERSQELKYTTDGAENSNPGFGDQSVVSKSRWDGVKLITESTRTVNTPNGDMTINTIAARSLSADGKVMTVETTTKGTPRGDQTRKQIFNKQ